MKDDQDRIVDALNAILDFLAGQKRPDVEFRRQVLELLSSLDRNAGEVALSVRAMERAIDEIRDKVADIHSHFYPPGEP